MKQLPISNINNLKPIFRVVAKDGKFFDMKIDEIWKDVEGYEEIYQVSDKGRVKSLKFGKERILKPSMNHKGYLQVNLCKNGKTKMCKVHRLVAMAFIPNPNCLPEVNHKDENKTNNRVDNLEWCTTKYNINYGTRTQRFVEKLKRQAEKLINGTGSKPVLQYSKSGEFIQEWKSTMDVERNLGYSNCSISACCRGKLKTAYNFVWKFK